MRRTNDMLLKTLIAMVETYPPRELYSGLLCLGLTLIGLELELSTHQKKIL